MISTHRGLRLSSFLMLTVLLSVILLTSINCKTKKEREAEQARLDSLYNDSTRKAFNPYKPSNGVDQYNRQREALGDINQYTTPPPVTVPERK